MGDDVERIAAIRSWRDGTRAVHDVSDKPTDTALTKNNRAWWRDVDTLLREIDARPEDTAPCAACGGWGWVPAPVDGAVRRFVAKHGVCVRAVAVANGTWQRSELHPKDGDCDWCHMVWCVPEADSSEQRRG